MDFLGLKTLTLIKDTVKLLKISTMLILIQTAFPLMMKKRTNFFKEEIQLVFFNMNLQECRSIYKELKPTVFADLIAMNALYRPGPLEYIPSFVDRKNGNEEISYDLPVMAEYLEETYGITVYQEQVMLVVSKVSRLF